MKRKYTKRDCFRQFLFITISRLAKRGGVCYKKPARKAQRRLLGAEKRLQVCQEKR